MESSLMSGWLDEMLSSSLFDFFVDCGETVSTHIVLSCLIKVSRLPYDLPHFVHMCFAVLNIAAGGAMELVCCSNDRVNCFAEIREQ